MPLNSILSPQSDPAPIFEAYRLSYGSKLLVAASAHFNLFALLNQAPLTLDELGKAIGLAARPTHVLVTALRAFKLLSADAKGRLELTLLAREHLVPGGEFDISDYLAQERENMGVLKIMERLKTNRPAGESGDTAGQGVAFIYREGMDSAMEREASARKLTLALAGRAKNVAPVLAQRADLRDAKLLLDVGGGTGIYSIAFLQKYPSLRAIVWDRPQVLKVAMEMAEAYGVSGRLECREGDMFTDPVPAADVILLSNILHDWDVNECRALLGHCAKGLSPNGKLLIHDAFLNDALDGPLSVALYSANLFCLTEGRAYSAAEYRAWLAEAGLVSGDVVPTLADCGVMTAVKK